MFERWVFVLVLEESNVGVGAPVREPFFFGLEALVPESQSCRHQGADNGQCGNRSSDVRRSEFGRRKDKHHGALRATETVRIRCFSFEALPTILASTVPAVGNARDIRSYTGVSMVCHGAVVVAPPKRRTRRNASTSQMGSSEPPASRCLTSNGALLCARPRELAQQLGGLCCGRGDLDHDDRHARVPAEHGREARGGIRQLARQLDETTTPGSSVRASSPSSASSP